MIRTPTTDPRHGDDDVRARSDIPRASRPATESLPRSGGVERSEQVEGVATTWLPSRKTLLRIGVAILFLVAAVFIGQKFLHMKELLATLAAIEPLYLAPILLLGLVYYLLKALRWHYYLREAEIEVPWVRSVSAYLAGQWFTFTPAGELMRACMLGGGTDFKLVAPTIVAQALADFLSLALVATLVVPLYPDLAPVVLPVTVPMLLTALVLGAPPLRALASTWPLVRWLARGKRREMVESAGHLLSPRPMGVGLLMGVPTILAGGFALYFAGLAVDLVQWGAVEAQGVYTMTQLLGGLSPLPQGLGVAEGSGTLILSYLGVDPTSALAAILLFRVAILGFSAVLGLLAFLALRLHDTTEA